MKPVINQNFGGYTLISRKGEGSTAEVWECADQDGNKKAIKIFAPTSPLDNYSKELIKEEFEKARTLNHPHLVVPEQYIEESGIPALIMKLCERSMWQELMLRSANNQSSSKQKNGGLFSEKIIVKLINQVSLAIQYLHNNSLVHNDIKPGNIMANNPDFDDRVVFYLTDFGITKEIRDTIIRQTKKNNSLTFAYAAPEKLRGHGGTTESDIFSLGASIYELMYGTGLEVPLGQILNNNGFVQFDSGNYSKELIQLLIGLLEKEPGDRTQLGIISRTTNEYLLTGTWAKSLTESAGDNERNTIRTSPPGSISTKDIKPVLPDFEDLQTKPHSIKNKDSGSHRSMDELIGRNFADLNLNTSNKKRKSHWVIGIFIFLGLAFLISVWIFLTPSIALRSYSNSIPLSNGYYLVEKDQMVGIIDKKGNIVKPLEYRSGVVSKDEVKLYKESGSEVFELNN